MHELLGHGTILNFKFLILKINFYNIGTGKLFQKQKDGTFNFDKENMVNPLTNELIDTYYDVNDTWHSIFG